MTDTPMSRALRLALGLFDGRAVDLEEIERNCDSVLQMLGARNDELPDRDELVKEVESRVVVWQSASVSLDDLTGHQEWLADRRPTIAWDFWDRYRRYMESEQMLPPAVIGRVDETTDRVLGRLEDPQRQGPWDRRGLVVGHVQSGKTGHYSSLVCKAADSGYKLIIVLAGLHNSLRSQTQLRLDEAFLGIDTQYGQRSDRPDTPRFGAGAMIGAEKLLAASLTTSHENGDFKKSVAQNLALPIGTMPIILIVKKHTGILKNVIRWITQMHGVPTNDGSGQYTVPEIPLLVIDDEADNASVNVRETGQDPTETNKQIRLLLRAFEKSAYVGYTATPFANIFSSPEESEEFGLDIFPRSFIESLKPPTNYFGPSRVFGLNTDQEEEIEPLPIVREINDYETWIPDRHRKDWQASEPLPASLQEAIRAFVLACAARRARGQVETHNSMLVHVTRFQQVQARVYEAIGDELQYLKYRVRYGDGNAEDVWEQLEELWENDFSVTSDSWPDAVEQLTWRKVKPHIEPAIEKIEIRLLNGNSRDALEYYEHRERGLSVIAIGGNKLSRGLTLEGLTVSYYLRASRMYDTLMQMGRWFGYRPGYEDLCRLYTTSTLVQWYREITVASEELRDEFEDMARRGSTPNDYGLRVRSSPAGLSVTAPNKMRNASTITLTFSEDVVETVTFDTRTRASERNLEVLEEFVTRLLADVGPPESDQPGFSGHVWRGVRGEVVAEEFFDHYVAEAKARRARPEFLSRYVKDSVRLGEITDWTVAIYSKTSRSGDSIEVGPLSVALTTRTFLDSTEDIRANRRATIRRVLSPDHEALDLDPTAKAAAFAETVNLAKEKAREEGREYRRPGYAAGKIVRRKRPPNQGLLLLYVLDNGPHVDDGKDHPVPKPLVAFAASFPTSIHNANVTYSVNDIWRLLALDDLLDGVGDD